MDVKNTAASLLRARGWAVEDVGTNGPESVDYPDIAERVARAVASGRAVAGVLSCGTGIGMSIAANKVRGVRAALAADAAAARMARMHNDANVLVVASSVSRATLEEMLDAFLETEFEGGRHQRRVDKIGRLEQCGGDEQ